jgi:phytoene synthase
MARPSRGDVLATPADRAACREAIRQGSRSFHLAGKLLPVEIREPAYAVYAFCRMADDLVDGADAAPDAIGEVARALDRVYRGRPRATYVERAFADAVRDHAIPRDVPEALVEGLAWDAEGRRYETMSELRAYAVRVAGSVGVMMSLVMDRREPHVLARACDLGIAMQLSNICRDVGEDARAGRVYLPADALADAGITASEVIGMDKSGPGLRGVVEAILAEAERHYTLAGAGIAELPRGARLGINASRLLYREIGRMVGRGVDPITTRAVVPGRRKLALLTAAAELPRHDPGALAAPCPAEAVHLVEAASRQRVASVAPRRPWWNLSGRAVRLVEMLAEFEAAPAGSKRR